MYELKIAAETPEELREKLIAYLGAEEVTEEVEQVTTTKAPAKKAPAKKKAAAPVEETYEEDYENYEEGAGEETYEEPTFTEDQVRAKMAAVTKKGEVQKRKAIAVIKKNGATKVSELDPSVYDAVMEELGKIK